MDKITTAVNLPGRPGSPRSPLGPTSPRRPPGPGGPSGPSGPGGPGGPPATWGRKRGPETRCLLSHTGVEGKFKNFVFSNLTLFLCLNQLTLLQLVHLIEKTLQHGNFPLKLRQASLDVLWKNSRLLLGLRFSFWARTRICIQTPRGTSNVLANFVKLMHNETTSRRPSGFTHRRNLRVTPQRSLDVIDEH